MCRVLGAEKHCSTSAIETCESDSWPVLRGFALTRRTPEKLVIWELLG